MIAQLLKTHILVPPPIFQNIFFWTSSLPPKNYKCKHKYKDYFLTTNEDRKDDLHIFHREMITNLTPCWQLVNTLLTPCWQLYKCNNLTFLWQMFDKCFHAKWVFSRCSDQVLSNVHGDYWAVNINIDFVKEGVGIRIQSNKPVSHNLVIGMLEWLSLIMITKTD